MGEVSVRFLDGERDAEVLRVLYETVIAPSFVAGEREPLARLARVLDAGELRGAVAVTAGGKPVGALFLEWFADIRAALLCYFAIRPDLRGQGIGRRLIAGATPRWRAELDPHVVFAEAGDPRFAEPGGPAEFGDGDARLRLYAGFGARRLPIDYLMPELSPGAGRLSGLLLLVIQAGPEVCPAPDVIRGAVVEGFLSRYFARQEGPAGPGDTRLRELLAQCRAADVMPLLPLS